jgi:hypothetical protein
MKLQGHILILISSTYNILYTNKLVNRTLTSDYRPQEHAYYQTRGHGFDGLVERILGSRLVKKWLLESVLETTELLQTKMVTILQQVAA